MQVVEFENQSPTRTWYQNNDLVGVGTKLYAVEHRGRYFSWCYSTRAAAAAICHKAEVGKNATPNWMAECNWRDKPEEATASQIAAQHIGPR